MARSAKKRPFASNYIVKSDKEDKRQVHRRERRAVRQMLHTDPERDLLPTGKQFGDSRDFSKGDKVYLPSLVYQDYRDVYLWLVERLRK